MDQTLYTRLDLYECTVVGNNDYLALHVIAYLQVCIESVPWMWSELFQTESNALLLVIEVEDNDIDFLIELYYLMRIVYATPREVCNVDESVNTAEVNEYTIVGDVLDCSFENLAFFEFADDLALLLLELSLKESLVRND